MTINERVSPERLDTIKSWRETYGQNANVMIPASEAESIISELQQYRAAAEPVAWVMKHDLADTDIISTPAYLSFSDAVTKTVGKLIPLYAAPQVTSVPDERPSLNNGIVGFDEGWNACRNAMLSDGTLINEGTTAAPAVQAEQTISEDYLQGHKDGCEWSARMAEANHPETGDWLFDDPIELAKAIRKGPDMLPAKSGNSPVIPDGYALVPLEPTLSMLTILGFTGSFESMKQRYESMLSAAPQGDK